MTALLPLGFRDPEPMDFLPIHYTNYTKEQAEIDNLAFDDALKQYLHTWIEQGTVSGVDQSLEADANVFIEQGALRSFFKHHDDALELLLKQEAIARHLLRPHTRVFFETDAYEPLLAKFERRIYNLAAHREHREVPFRYSPASRQGDHGDSLGLTDRATGEVREDIGCYFGTRRSDTTALNLLARQLRSEAVFSTSLPIHVVTEGYMEDSLRAIRKTTEQLQNDGLDELHCFVVQRRHAADDRHLGAALLLMHTRQPERPQRVLFCDTLKPDGLPPWWDKFRRYVDAVFPQPSGVSPVSERLEDGGVDLQRLHDGVPVRHQDIDCAFYTTSMGKALIQIARLLPELLLTGSIEAIVSQMTERMPEYYDEANLPKAPQLVREVNVIRRWQTGQQALIDLREANLLSNSQQTSDASDETGADWEPANQLIVNLEICSAA